MKKSFESLFATYRTISVPAPLISTDAWPPAAKRIFSPALQRMTKEPPRSCFVTARRAADKSIQFHGRRAPTALRYPPCTIRNAASLFLPEAGGVSDCRKKSGCAGLFRHNGVRKPGCARLANPPHMSMDSELVRRAQALRPSQACRSFSRDAPCRRSRWLPCRGHSARR